MTQLNNLELLAWWKSLSHFEQSNILTALTIESKESRAVRAEIIRRWRARKDLTLDQLKILAEVKIVI